MSNPLTHLYRTIMHPSLDADAISRLLQLEAQVKHTVGERRRSPLSNEFLDETYGESFWSHLFCSAEGKEIALFASLVLVELSHRAGSLQDIRQTGGILTLSVPVSSEEEKHTLQQGLASAAKPLARALNVERWGHPHALLG